MDGRRVQQEALEFKHDWHTLRSITRFHEPSIVNCCSGGIRFVVSYFFPTLCVKNYLTHKPFNGIDVIKTKPKLRKKRQYFVRIKTKHVIFIFVDVIVGVTLFFGYVFACPFGEANTDLLHIFCTDLPCIVRSFAFYRQFDVKRQRKNYKIWGTWLWRSQNTWLLINDHASIKILAQ